MLTRLIAALTLVTIAICFIFADVIQAALWWIAVIGALFLAGAGVITLAIGWQRFRMVKAQADEMANKAAIVSTPHADYTVRSPKRHLVQLTNSPLLEWNGKDTGRELTNIERWAWYTQQSHKELPTPEIIIEQPTQQDLLTLIDQYPHTLVWGGTGGGKTSLLRTIAHRRKLQGHQVLVLDSREHPAKWAGLERMETEGKINRSIEILFKILRQNVEALREGKAVETDFKQITVITDEWTEIVAENEIARQFISEMVRQSRKYGIYLVFATQTDLAMDLGLDGRYKTINGFLRLELKKLNENYVATAKVGLGQKLGEFPVPIPPPVPMIAPTGYLAPGLETTRPDNPNSDEQTVLDLLAQDKSYRQISQEVWGGVGSWYNQKIKAIAQKYDARE